MIKIRFNQEHVDDLAYHIKLNGRSLTIEAERNNDFHIYADRIPVLREYNCYSLIYAPGRGVLRYHDILYQTNAIFYDLNAIAQPLRRHFDNALEMFNRNGIIANVTTGIIAQDWRPAENRDIIIDVLQGTKEKTTLEIDGEYITEDFCMSKVQQEGFARDQVWDSYALIVGDQKYMASSRELALKNDLGFDGKLPGVIEYTPGEKITMEVQKFDSRYHPTKLQTRDIDCDEVVIETTAGLANARRIYLENGHGKFQFDPLDYEGKMHIKLGRRWYVVCDDYIFTLKKKEEKE